MVVCLKKHRQYPTPLLQKSAWSLDQVSWQFYGLQEDGVALLQRAFCSPRSAYWKNDRSGFCGRCYYRDSVVWRDHYHKSYKSPMLLLTDHSNQTYFRETPFYFYFFKWKQKKTKTPLLTHYDQMYIRVPFFCFLFFKTPFWNKRREQNIQDNFKKKNNNTHKTKK